jgi:hypothetical protein
LLDSAVPHFSFDGREATPKTSRSSTITEAGREEQETQAGVAGRDARRGVLEAAGHEQLPSCEGDRCARAAHRRDCRRQAHQHADTDLRLCRFFGLSDGWWLRFQAEHDTEVAKASLAKTLAQIKPWKEADDRRRMRNDLPLPSGNVVTVKNMPESLYATMT